MPTTLVGLIHIQYNTLPPQSHLYPEDVSMPDETSVNPITLQGLPAPGLPAPERNLGQLLYQLPAEVKTLIRKLEKFLYKLNAAENAITFNKVCMKEGLLPKYYYYYYYS